MWVNLIKLSYLKWDEDKRILIYFMKFKSAFVLLKKEISCVHFWYGFSYCLLRKCIGFFKLINGSEKEKEKGN
jgi:hypothetical protein